MDSEKEYKENLYDDSNISKLDNTDKCELPPPVTNKDINISLVVMDESKKEYPCLEEENEEEEEEEVVEIPVFVSNITKCPKCNRNTTVKGNYRKYICEKCNARFDEYMLEGLDGLCGQYTLHGFLSKVQKFDYKCNNCDYLFVKSPKCPYCKSDNTDKIETCLEYKCNECGHVFAICPKCSRGAKKYGYVNDEPRYICKKCKMNFKDYQFIPEAVKRQNERRKMKEQVNDIKTNEKISNRKIATQFGYSRTTIGKWIGAKNRGSAFNNYIFTYCSCRCCNSDNPSDKKIVESDIINGEQIFKCSNCNIEYIKRNNKYYLCNCLCPNKDCGTYKNQEDVHIILNGKGTNKLQSHEGYGEYYYQRLKCMVCGRQYYFKKR